VTIRLGVLHLNLAGQKMSGKVKDSDASAPPSDWWLSDEDQGWLDILQAIEEGRPPDHEVLAKLLRNSRYVVDQRVRDYLADHLEGKIRKPRGRPADMNIERVGRNIIIRSIYWRNYDRLAAIPGSERLGTASEVAFEETVTQLAERNILMSAGQVRKIVYSEGTRDRRRSQRST
jgi:hypothetical protein